VWSLPSILVPASQYQLPPFFGAAVHRTGVAAFFDFMDGGL
jgi:hypothetical protein